MLDPIGQRRIAGQLDPATVLIGPEVRQARPARTRRHAEQGRRRRSPAAPARRSSAERDGDARAGDPTRRRSHRPPDAGTEVSPRSSQTTPSAIVETGAGQPGDVRRAAHRHHHHVGRHPPLAVGEVPTTSSRTPSADADPVDRVQSTNSRTVLAVPVQEHPAQVVAVQPGQRVRLVAHQRHPAPQHERGRGQLGADQTGPDDRHGGTRSQQRPQADPRRPASAASPRWPRRRPGSCRAAEPVASTTHRLEAEPSATVSRRLTASNAVAIVPSRQSTPGPRSSPRGRCRRPDGARADSPSTAAGDRTAGGVSAPTTVTEPANPDRRAARAALETSQTSTHDEEGGRTHSTA